MRVLWLSHFVPYPPTGHGALQRSYHLLAQTASRHETHLVATMGAGAFDEAGLAAAHEALGRLCASVTLVPLAPSAGRERLRRPALAARSLVSGQSYWDHLFWHREAASAVGALVRRGAVDVAHVDIVFLRPYLRLLGRTPVVLNHHNVESHLLHRRAQAAGRLGRSYFGAQARMTERAEIEVARRVAHNVVVSDLDGERLRALTGATEVTTVRNGVDLDFFRSSSRPAPGPARLVWAGGMDWFPNGDAIRWLATELWPALAADGAGRQVDVVGRNPPAEIVELAARDPRVRVHGFVDDVRPYLERATAYLCPIRVGGGTRLKVLDALAMRIPLVGTTIGVEGLGLRDGAEYLRADSVPEFVRAVRRLEEEPALGAALVDAGRAHVEAQYGWDRIGSELAAVHEAAARAVPTGAARATAGARG
ncbi:glycosyltransferase [Roseisolibacter sp. H3M3-2]|uniref:glycosyltransferase n=1 Tax=Roseisolibacter sp. H3M3-2 TaxID=3031323 RepID=UPI0023DA31C4|nr:glycosyltransferase [Roseisolibacter sp. H3M3-2]MDF1505352.1 glycosyltransferase [Roseisolibacter sp. H3M3-2]